MLRSILKLVGREILLEPALASVSSWPSLSSRVVRDFKVEGSEDNALMCFEEGRKILTIGHATRYQDI